MGTSIISGIGVDDELAGHWAQGYHRAMDASSSSWAKRKQERLRVFLCQLCFRYLLNSGFMLV
jgi:hypothetical protein